MLHMIMLAYIIRKNEPCRLMPRRHLIVIDDFDINNWVHYSGFLSTKVICTRLQYMMICFLTREVIKDHVIGDVEKHLLSRFTECHRQLFAR